MRYLSLDKGIQNKLIDFVKLQKTIATKVLCETLHKHKIIASTI